MIVNHDKKKNVNSACQILFVCISAVPFNREEEKRDVTNHAPQMDIVTGPYLPQFLPRKLAKIQSL